MSIKFIRLTPSAIRHAFLRPLDNKSRLPDQTQQPLRLSIDLLTSAAFKTAKHPFLKLIDPIASFSTHKSRQSIRSIPYNYPNLCLSIPASNDDNPGG